MGLGRMTRFIDIIEVQTIKDSEGFATRKDNILASMRAYREEQRGSEAWRNRAVFTTANALFRLRVIPGLKITPSMFILCGGDRYSITHVDDVRDRQMYIEILAEKIKPAKGGGVVGENNNTNT